MNILNFFYKLVRPKFWVGAYKESIEQDQFINNLLDKLESGELTAKVTCYGEDDEPLSITVADYDYEIWTANYPYAYGYTFSTDGNQLIRIDRRIPFAKTRVRLKKYVDSIK